MRNLVIILVMFVTILGPSAVIAAIGYASIRALGRNPSGPGRWLLYPATGEARGDSQAQRRQPFAGHSLRERPRDPAGHRPGVDTPH